MKIYVYDITKIDEEIIQGLMSQLSEDRQRKIKSKRIKEDRLRSFAAGQALKFALEEKGIDERKAAYFYTEHKKPYIKKDSEQRLHFNISHSGKYAIAVVDDNEVGVDIEAIREYRRGVVDRCFTQKEKDRIKTSGETKDAFFVTWTLKESYLKMTGEGITRDLKEVETCYNEFDDSAIVYNTTKEKKSFAKVVRDIESYVISVCAAIPIQDVELVYVN